LEAAKIKVNFFLKKRGLRNMEIDWKIAKKTQQRLKWSNQYTNMVKQEYERFLQLCKEHPTVNFVPSKVVDEMWHDHIYTRKIILFFVLIHLVLIYTIFLPSIMI